MGFKVFPLREDNPNEPPSEIKKPALKGDWKQHATSNPNQIIKWWSEKNYNPAIATLPDNELVILDYDCKPGQKGQQAWDTHEAVGLEHTFVVETPTGGKHSYFLAPEGTKIPNSASKIAENVDVRGQSGGYVVAPGSTIHGKPYTVVKMEKLRRLPSWLAKKALTGRKRTATKQGEVLGEVDTEGAIAARLFGYRVRPLKPSKARAATTRHSRSHVAFGTSAFHLRHASNSVGTVE